MQKTERRIKHFIMCIVMALCITVGLKAPIDIKATSATLTFTADNKSVSVGDTFYVVVILDSSDTIGGFEGYVSYDSNLVEFIEGGNFVNGNGGLLRIYDMDSTDATSTKKYSLQFKAKKVGDCIFDTSDAPAVYNADDDELSVSSNMLTVSISNSQSLSNNYNLAKLLISPGTLDQVYNNDVTNYKVEIPHESDMLFISAEPEEEEAVVTVEGNTDLKVGLNYVHVVVTAPSGAKKDVQIEVTRLDKQTEVDRKEEIEKEETGVTVSTTEDNKKELESVHRYEIVELEDATMIPKGYEETSVKIDQENVKAYTTTNNLQNEFVLLYLTNENGETGFYQYDRVEKTLQRFQQEKSYEEDDILGSQQGNTSEMSPTLIIIAAMAGIIIILSIALAIFAMKRKRDKEDRDDDYLS